MWYKADRGVEYTLSLAELEEFFIENQEDIQRIQAITQRRKDLANRPMNMWQTLQGFWEDSYVDGFVTTYPHGTVISQGERRNFFRGEAEDYPGSKTTLWREVAECTTKEQKVVVRLLAAMRVIEFCNFLDKTKYIKWWKDCYGVPFYEAIAQHYGFMTEYLDITNDFNVAMFFACCKWDNEKKAWRPMTEEECKEKGRGVLYHAPLESVRFYIDVEKQNIPKVLPIGYQPFMRCQKQTGYVLQMKEDEDFKYNTVFRRMFFEHSTKLSEGVFEYMENGDGIYPQEPLRMFDEEIDKMKIGTTFSSDVFEAALARLNLTEQKDEMLRLLREADFRTNYNFYGNIEIGQNLHPVTISRQRINRLNLKTETSTPEKDNGIELTTRWTLMQ